MLNKTSEICQSEKTYLNELIFLSCSMGGKSMGREEDKEVWHQKGFSQFVRAILL